MAVVTIDAKGELAELQAMQESIPGVPAPTEAPPAEPAAEPVHAPGTDQSDAANDPDDVEGADGLTPREKRELSEKMRRSLGKRIAQRKDAEEFAAAQYNERRLAEQRAAALERENAELKAKAQPAQPEAQPDPEAGKPTRDKFDSDQAYWDAYVDWRAERKAEAKIKEQAAKDAKAADERRAAEILETAKSRIGKALEIVPDFEQVTKSLIGTDVDWVPEVVAGYMQKSPMFAELGYHLAKNPDILRSILKLPPDEQLVTIGKIEGTLKPFEPKGSKAATTNGATPSETAINGKDARASAEPSETGSTPSRARSSAPVITPLNGNSGAAVEKDPGDMNTREMIHDWSKRNRANLGLRKRH